MLDLGPTEQSIAKMAIRMGGELPERIANAPKLTLGLSFYLQAFFDLDADRAIGMSIGRIPWTSVLSYASFHELDTDETELLIKYVEAIDTTYLKHQSEKHNA